MIRYSYFFILFVSIFLTTNAVPLHRHQEEYQSLSQHPSNLLTRGRSASVFETTDESESRRPSVHHRRNSLNKRHGNESQDTFEKFFPSSFERFGNEDPREEKVDDQDNDSSFHLQDTALEEGNPDEGEANGPSLYGSESNTRSFNNANLTVLELNDDLRVLRREFKKTFRPLNKKKIINIFTTRTPSQLKQIAAEYELIFKTPLEKEISGHTRGDLRRLLLSCMWDKYEFEAQSLKKAFGEGSWLASSSKETMREILIGRTNEELAQISEKYKSLTGNELTESVKKYTQGYYQTLLLSLLRGRDEMGSADVDADVKVLFDVYTDKYSSANIEQRLAFIEIFTRRSVDHLRNVMEKYETAYNKSIFDVISERFSFSLMKSLIQIGHHANNESSYYASLFYLSGNGLGTDDEKLARLVVRHFRIEHIYGPDRHEAIEIAYKQTYGQSLFDKIKDETSSISEKSFSHALQSIINHVNV